jgi:electron transport complex protein RnfB
MLGLAAIKFRVEGDPLVDKIDAILPQTQCGQCGYPGCKPYAKAIAADEADINQCPPGGESGVKALADLLGKDPKPLQVDGEQDGDEQTLLAVIDEQTCIGCTKCIQVCPVDAIVGAAKQKHTVLDVYCTGCKLCLPPVCPVENCLTMITVQPAVTEWVWPAPVSDEPQRETGT